MWELFAEDGEMKMYKMEMELDGNIVDPLKAVHSVKVCLLFVMPFFKVYRQNVSKYRISQNNFLLYVSE